MQTFDYLSSVLMLLSNLVGVLCAMIFISVLIVSRQCRTTTTLFGLNSMIAGLFVNLVYACQACYQLSGAGPDRLCVFRGFLLHMSCGLLYHTFCIQALYRLLVTTPIHWQYLRSKGMIKLIILIQWLISSTFALPILRQNQITFHAGSRICQISVDDISGCAYLGVWIYFLPIMIIIGIYIRVIVYIQKQSIFDPPRQKRELRLHRRIIMLVTVLFITGFPYLVFFVITQFAHVSVSPYSLRICYVFISLGQGTTMLLCLINTANVRQHLSRRIRKVKRRCRQRRVHCINVIQLPVQIVPVNPM